MLVRSLLAAALMALVTFSGVCAQDVHWPDYDTLQTQMFFGMHSAEGKGVSEQDWAGFLEKEITPRFPDGLTVLFAYGQGTGGPPGGVIAENTKVLVVVHENTNEAQAKFSDIEAAYKRQFGDKGVFRIDSPVRIAD